MCLKIPVLFRHFHRLPPMWCWQRWRHRRVACTAAKFRPKRRDSRPPTEKRTSMLSVRVWHSCRRGFDFFLEKNHFLFFLFFSFLFFFHLSANAASFILFFVSTSILRILLALRYWRIWLGRKRVTLRRVYVVKKLRRIVCAHWNLQNPRKMRDEKENRKNLMIGGRHVTVIMNM